MAGGRGRGAAGRWVRRAAALAWACAAVAGTARAQGTSPGSYYTARDVDGRVASVDGSRSVNLASGALVRLRPDTQVFDRGVHATPADLRPGDDVRMTFGSVDPGHAMRVDVLRRVGG